MRAQNILETIGNTPTIRVNRLFRDIAPNAEVWIKSERANPGASIKDRIALSMIEAAEASGELKRGGTIVEPTSGQYRHRAGDGRCSQRLSVDPGDAGKHVDRAAPVDAGLWRQVRVNAARERHAGLDRAREATGRADAGAWMPQQFDNPANIDVHVRTTAQEVLRDFPEAVRCRRSPASVPEDTSRAMAQVLKPKWPQLKVFAVEPAASPVISGGKPSPHPIQGIGAGFIPKNLKTELLDGVILVEAEEAREMARRAAREEGVLVGISSGAALAAIAKKLPELKKDARVLGFNYDTGERYLSIEGFLPAEPPPSI